MGYSDIKEMLKDARNIATGANDIQTVNLLKDIQLEVYDLLEENRNLLDEIKELKNEKLIQDNLIYKNNAYFKKESDQIPYCTKCFDVDRKLVVMSKRSVLYHSTYNFYCPNCKNEYDSYIKNPRA